MSSSLMRRCLVPVAIVFITALPCGAWAQEQEPPPPQDDHMAVPPVSNLTTRVFGDLQWWKTRGPDTPNSFALGQFDLFTTATLNDRISFLAEIVLEGSVNTRVVTDLERLQITFRVNNFLNISGGRYHTGIGFYNSAFHHGAFFETAIGRPRVFEFEDEGGVLPVHDVGVSVRGAVPRTGAALQYLFELGNGRNWNVKEPADETAGELDGSQDTNENKSLNVGLAYWPERWSGLEIGGSYLRDTIPVNRAPSVDHRIATAYVVYRKPSIELLAEWLNLQSRAAGGSRIGNGAGYVQLSKAWGRVRPYYRYDRLKINPLTPLIGATPSYRANVAGVRIELGEWVGLKAQYEHGDDMGRHGMDSIQTQLVFVF